jgi:hypothetical protein
MFATTFIHCVAGGRFKKEVIIDGQSYLLLIRDEGGAPEMQVSKKKLVVFFRNFTCISFEIVHPMK